MGLYLDLESYPPSRELKTKYELQKFLLELFNPAVIAFPTNTHSDFFTRYFDLANNGRNTLLKFAHTFDPSLAEKHRLRQDTFAIFRPKVIQSEFEPGVAEFRGSLDNVSAAMSELLQTATPLIHLRTAKGQKWLEYPHVVVYLIAEGVAEKGGEALGHTLTLDLDFGI